MKPMMTAAILAAIFSNAAYADSRVERFCGAKHQNEIASQDDVRSNPAGYYVVSLAEQVGEGDPRIVLTNDADFHLCTRLASTPDMSANDVYRQDGRREVMFLFVPILEWSAHSSS